MLTVALLFDGAYGVALLEEITLRSRRSVSIGALHSALERLEAKGFLRSRMGEATAERGGRRKRYFTLTPAGEYALREVRELRDSMWKAIPQTALSGGAS